MISYVFFLSTDPIPETRRFFIGLATNYINPQLNSYIIISATFKHYKKHNLKTWVCPGENTHMYVCSRTDFQDMGTPDPA